MKIRTERRAALFAAFASSALALRGASAADPPPGYLEPVVQWGVQKDQTCEDIAQSLYGSPKHANLVLRYNRVVCDPDKPLPEGLTLILPEKVTAIPDAKLRSVNPLVRARPAGGSWTPAEAGMPLYSNASVNSLKEGRADIEFVDHTRIFLAANTLVVIYGTASRTKVSKTPPPIIEVEEGELRAGIAALRGEETIDVAIKGGGRVNAASRDAVVERKGERTTVAVFDGKAAVSSGGATIHVPQNFGTRFLGVAPPIPPRPLPPAPLWKEGTSEGISLAPGGSGLLRASWNAVPNALRYRFEVSRDQSFHDLIVREEIPGDVLAFRAEKLPPGKYYLSVRAIDKEEYLGIAATREALLLSTAITGSKGVLDERTIQVNPYSILRFSPSPGVEMAIDEGPFGPIVPSIDLGQRSASKLRFRGQASSQTRDITLQYDPIRAEIEAKRESGRPAIAVKVRLSGLESIDIPAAVGPRARAHLGGGIREAKLTLLADRTLSAELKAEDAPANVRIDVVDFRGKVLGSSLVDLDESGTPTASLFASPSPSLPSIGALSPIRPLSSALDVSWWSPTAPTMMAVSGSGSIGDGQGGTQVAARASAEFDPFGVDATMIANTSGQPGDDSAWIGARYRPVRIGSASFEHALALRVGFPLNVGGPSPRLEPSLAFGGAESRFTWLADIGARVRLADDPIRKITPSAQGFLLFGGTLDLLPWLRSHALLDSHLLFKYGSDQTLARFGLGVGLEAGSTLFASLSGRVSPWQEEGGLFTGQLALGFRERPR